MFCATRADRSRLAARDAPSPQVGAPEVWIAVCMLTFDCPATQYSDISVQQYEQVSAEMGSEPCDCQRRPSG